LRGGIDNFPHALDNTMNDIFAGLSWIGLTKKKSILIYAQVGLIRQTVYERKTKENKREKQQKEHFF